MRHALFFLLLIGALSGQAEEGAELQQYSHCIIQLNRLSSKLNHWASRLILPFDRTLMHMQIGSQIYEGNFQLLVQTFGGKEPEIPMDRLLVSNAVEGCRNYHRIYKERAFLFFGFVISLTLLVLVFTLRVLMSFGKSPATTPITHPSYAGAANTERKPQDH